MLYSFTFFAGVAALLASPGLPARWLVIALGVLGVVAGLWCWRARAVALAVCGGCCGFLFAAYCAREALAHRWPVSLTDERVIASVVVDSIPAPLGAGWAFDGIVRIDTPERAPAGAEALWSDEFRARLVLRDAEFRPHAGERWRLMVSLRPPRGRANPGAADFERHQFRDGVGALGTVVPSGVNRLVDEGHRPLTRLRERISERIDAVVVDRDASALISALAVGDTGRVSREQWRVFNATGTTHLVAISGMHVTLFAVIMFALARYAWKGCVTWGAPVVRDSRSPLAPRRVAHIRACGGLVRAITLLPSRSVAHLKAGAWLCQAIAALPRETFAAVFGFTAALGYAVLAGLSVPTERTLIMLGAWLLARSVARASHPFQPFGLALLAVLLIDPFAPLSAGFWLSFAAMAAIILASSGRVVRQPLWREALSIQVVVSLALLPFTFALFGSVPLIGFPVNLLAIPAMSWVLVPTVLLALAMLPISAAASNAVLMLAEWLHNIGWPWLAAASDVPWALIHASPPWWWYALAVVALALAALPWPLPMRLAALICVAPLAALIERPLKPGSAEITVLDVGEGSAIVIRTAGHVLVYGTGDSYGTEGRIAETVVAPFVRSSGARAIDRLVLPRTSPASGAGVAALWAELPIRETLVGGDTAEAGSTDCASVPSQWVWDGVTFALGDGGHACPLSIRSASGEILIPGDLDAVIVAGTAHRWAVVSGRRAQRAFEKYARAHPELEGADVLVAADRGAIRIPFDRARGAGDPQAQRAHRRTLWSYAP